MSSISRWYLDAQHSFSFKRYTKFVRDIITTLQSLYPLLKIALQKFSLYNLSDGIWRLFLEVMLTNDLYHIIPLLHKFSLRFVRNHEAPVVEWFKTQVAKSRNRGFESHREPKVNFLNFILNSKFKSNFNFKQRKLNN